MAFGDVVQSNKGTGTTTTTTPTLGSSITAGNLVVLTFASDDYNGTPDSGWQQSAEMEQQTFHGCYIWWFIASGGDTIPGYTIGSNTVSAWVVTEYEGPFDDSPVSDSQGQFAQSTGGSYTTDNVTPPTGDHLLVAAIGGSASSEDVSGAYSSWLNSFVEVDHQGTTGGGTDDCIGTASRVVTGDGSTAFSSGATYPNAVQSRTGLIIAFKAAAAAPPQYGRNYYPKRSAGDVSTTSNTVWSTVASKTFTPEASTDYWVIWSGDVRVASTSNDVQHRIFDGTTAYDAGNLEANDTAPNEYFSAAGVFKYTSGGSPSAITFSFQVKAETNGTTVSGRNAQIVIIKAKSTDQWVETTGSSATSTTEQTKQTLTWTPDQTRDYIIIGAGAMIDASTTAGLILRLKDGTPTTQSTSYGASNDGTNVVRAIVVDYAPGLTAVSQTYTLTTQDVGSSGGSISDRRILALDVTGENVWENTAGDGSTNNTASYADSKTFTQSLTNTAEHLVFAAGGMAGNSTTVTGMVQTVIDGTSVGETVQENSSTANMIFNHNVVWLGTLSSGSRTFKTQAKNESGTVTVQSYQTKYVVWDIQSGAGSQSYSLACATGAFTLSGIAASLKASRKIAGGTGAFNLTGVAAGAKVGRNLPATTGPFTLSGIAVGFRRTYALQATVGAFNWTGIAAGLKAARNVAAGTGAFTLSGVATGLKVGRSLPAGTGAFTLTGIAANLKRTYALQATVGTFTLTGQDIALLRAYVLAMGTGAFNLSGVAARLAAARRLALTAGSFTLAGIAAGVKVGRNLPVSAGAFTLTGNAANFPRGKGIVAATGTFTLTGNNAALLRTYVLQATAATFTLNGLAVGLKAARTLAVAPGAFTLSGQAVGLRRGLSMAAAAGAFTLNGQSAALLRTYVLTAGTASFSLTGIATGLKAGRSLAAATGAFTLNGQAVRLSYDHRMPAGIGAFVLTGNDAGLISPQARLYAGTGAFTFTGIDVALRATRVAQVAAGAFNLSGQAAALRVGRNLPVAAGSFALSGQSANFPLARKLVAGTGAFVLTGNDANLQGAQKRLTATVANFVLTGIAAGLRTSRRIAAGKGTFTLTGISARLAKDGKLVATAGAYALSGKPVGLRVGRAISLATGAFNLAGIATRLAHDSRLIATPGAFVWSGVAITFSRTTLLAPAAGRIASASAGDRTAVVLSGARVAYALTQGRSSSA